MQSVIVIGVSTGGVQALNTLLSGLPADLPAAVVVVMHIGDHPSILPALLQPYCALPVTHARDRQPLTAGTVLIAPPGQHLLLVRENETLITMLSHGPRENGTRPAIDPLFRSTAAAAGACVIGVILTGYLDDGVAGLQAIKACGGLAIVQDPASAMVPDMPRNALDQVDVDLCLPLSEMAAALVQRAPLCPAGLAAPELITPPESVAVENMFAAGHGGIAELKRIATPSAYSCPDCGGALFSVNQSQPARYRCHTGHSFTLLSLLKEQDGYIEEGMWSVIRALHEKERMAEQLATEFTARSLMRDPGYAEIARDARRDAEQMRDFLARQQADE
jgi:two-component system chemotaxis response regulator CheB